MKEQRWLHFLELSSSTLSREQSITEKNRWIIEFTELRVRCSRLGKDQSIPVSDGISPSGWKLSKSMCLSVLLELLIIEKKEIPEMGKGGVPSPKPIPAIDKSTNLFLKNLPMPSQSSWHPVTIRWSFWRPSPWINPSGISNAVKTSSPSWSTSLQTM